VILGRKLFRTVRLLWLRIPSAPL